jgi:hypothetical protein
MLQKNANEISASEVPMVKSYDVLKLVYLYGENDKKPFSTIKSGYFLTSCDNMACHKVKELTHTFQDHVVGPCGSSMELRYDGCHGGGGKRCSGGGRSGGKGGGGGNPPPAPSAAPAAVGSAFVQPARSAAERFTKGDMGTTAAGGPKADDAGTELPAEAKTPYTPWGTRPRT